MADNSITMMKIPLYVIDAFTQKVFGGNPAAVCPLEDWLSDEQLQSIAQENNLSETAFFVKRGESIYELRWFTPTIEVDLCGHATLASAFVIFNYLDGSSESVTFATRESGALTVSRDGDQLTLDFPARRAEFVAAPDELLEGLKANPKEVLLSHDYLAVYDSEEAVRALRPDMGALMKLDRQGVIATAVGVDCDFFSRYFAPRAGIPEDPVTGAAHCTLVPYWAERLSKRKLHARQVSPRGGELFCEHVGDRVKISGYAAKYAEGFLYL